LKLNLKFPILHDQNNTLAGQFGLVFPLPADMCLVYRSFGIDLERFNGDSSWSLPMPARFIIGQDGMIHEAVVNLEHTLRPEPDGIFEALDALGA
jgi:peroxiredoxin